MSVSRNKLLLNMAQKGVQKEINEISDLANFKKTMRTSCDDSDTECELIQLSDLQAVTSANLDIGSFDKSSLPILGNDTLEQLLFDENEQNSAISITTSAEIHCNPNGSPVNSVCPQSRSITPMPPEFISFETESQLPELIVEDDVLRSFNQQIPSPSILTTDSSATSSASGASSECSSPSSTVMSGRKRRKFTVDVTKKRRKCRKENWIDTRRKLLLNFGKKHLSRNGNEQKQKDMRPPCENCKFKCRTKTIDESRGKIFDLFSTSLVHHQNVLTRKTLLENTSWGQKVIKLKAM